MIVSENDKPLPTQADMDAITAQKKLKDDEMGRIYARWRNWYFDKDWTNDAVGKKIAVVLDNMHIFYGGNEPNEPEFRKVAVDLAWKVFGNFVPFHMVSVQPMMKPVDTAYVHRFKFTKELDTPPIMKQVELGLHTETEEITAKTKRLRFHIGNEHRTAKGDFNAECVEKMAKEIRCEIAREVMLDLRNNAGTIAEKRVETLDELTYESVYINLVEMSGVIHRKTLKGGINWIVAGPKIAKVLSPALFRKDLDLDALDEPTHVGTLNGVWKLIVDPKYPEKELLCGYYEEYVDGYIYSPYITAILAPVVLDPDTFEAKRQIWTRYAKKLTRAGAKAYGRIKYLLPEDKSGKELNHE